MSIRADLRGTRGVTVVGVAFAIVYLVIGVATRDAWVAVAGPVIMLGYLAVLFAFRRRSEPAAMLSGAVEDERQRRLTVEASAVTGNVLVAAVLIAFFVALATGATTVAHVLSGLGALAGVTFGVAVVWLSRHR